MSKQSAAEKSAMKLPGSSYIAADISDELTREIILPGGFRHVIANPKTLIIRVGGSTHRVIDANGIVHCYAAPETGNSVIRWVPRDPKNPVKF